MQLKEKAGTLVAGAALIGGSLAGFVGITAAASPASAASPTAALPAETGGGGCPYVIGDPRCYHESRATFNDANQCALDAANYGLPSNSTCYPYDQAGTLRVDAYAPGCPAGVFLEDCHLYPVLM